MNAIPPPNNALFWCYFSYISEIRIKNGADGFWDCLEMVQKCKTHIKNPVPRHRVISTRNVGYAATVAAAFFIVVESTT